MSKQPQEVNGNVVSIKKPNFHRKPLSQLAKTHPGQTPMLVRNYFPSRSIITLFGEPGSGKTTLVSDVICSIDTGSPWRENKTIQGIVWYIAAEDPYGVRLRLESWYIHHDMDFEETRIEVIEEPICFADMESVNRFIQDINNAINKPIIIVIDTLSDIADKYDLNSDMGLFMQGFERFRNETGCTIFIIHHCGHNAKDRPRNGSELGGKSDVIMSITCENDITTLDCKKMKNGSKAKAQPLSWSLKTVTTKWLDNDGESITSVVLEDSNAPAKANQLGDKQQQSLDALRRLYQEHQANLAAGGIDQLTAQVRKTDWDYAMRDIEPDKSNRRRIRNALISKNLVIESGDYVKPV